MLNIIIGFVIFQIVYLLSSFVINNQTSTIRTIEILDGQFNPKVIAINSSDYIVFKNIGKLGHWPASNSHPTHDILPEFDPQQPIKPNEEWKFQFNNPGIWRYHDHLNATKSGVILVKENPKNNSILSLGFKRLSETFDRSYKLGFSKIMGMLFIFNPDQKDNYLQNKNIKNLVQNKDEAVLYLLIDQFGPYEVMQKLFLESKNATKFNCHSYAHTIGRLSFEMYGSQSLQNYIPHCHSGYSHGAMAAYVSRNGEKDLALELDRICEPLKSYFSRMTCYHGSGHGLMGYLNNELPEALQTCKQFNEKYKRSSCFVGAFMENIGSWSGDSLNSHPSIWLSTTDPHYPCNKLEKDFEIQEACYSIQPNWMDFLFSRDMQQVVDQCLKADANYIGICFFGYGQEAASFEITNIQKIISLCDLVPKTSNYYQQCIFGAQTVIMDFWGSAMTNQGEEICLLVKEKEVSLKCLDRYKARMSDLSNAKNSTK